MFDNLIGKWTVTGLYDSLIIEWIIQMYAKTSRCLTEGLYRFSVKYTVYSLTYKKYHSLLWFWVNILPHISAITCVQKQFMCRDKVTTSKTLPSSIICESHFLNVLMQYTILVLLINSISMVYIRNVWITEPYRSGKLRNQRGWKIWFGCILWHVNPCVIYIYIHIYHE